MYGTAFRPEPTWTEPTPDQTWTAGHTDGLHGRPSEEDTYEDPDAYQAGYLAGQTERHGLIPHQIPRGDHD